MKNLNFIKYALSLSFCLMITFTTYSQLQNANWYFGNQTGLNFNDGTSSPTILDDGVMNTIGGSVTVSDEYGNLLFYTNGVNVWNRDHQIMPDGSGLNGSATVSQSVVVLQEPNDNSKYYIVTNQGLETGSNGLSYSYLDTDAEDQLGNVDAAQKNVQLLPYASEKLTAVFNPDDSTYWLISFAPSTDPTVSDTFYSFKVDGSGINLATQSTFSFRHLPNKTFSGGQMKISPDLETIAMVHNTASTHARYGLQGCQSLYTFDFDDETGEVSALKESFMVADLNYFGLEFSPNSDFLYVSTTHEFSDLSVYPIVESEVGRIHQIFYKDIGQVNPGCSTLIYEGPDPIYSMQLGLYRKIYVVNSSGNLSTINAPDSPGILANYIHESIDLTGKAMKGLPQLVPYNNIVGESADTKVYTILNNPFNAVLNLQFHVKGRFKLRLYDIFGKKVKEDDAGIKIKNQIIKIKADSFSPGIYFLHIKDVDNNKWSDVLIKNH